MKDMHLNKLAPSGLPSSIVFGEAWCCADRLVASSISTAPRGGEEDV